MQNKRKNNDLAKKINLKKMKIKNIFIIAAILIMSVPFLQSCDDESTSKLSFEIICEDTIAPCIVQFNNTSIGYDKFFWEFGDGSTSEEKNPTHEYETDSTYEVILRDKDNNANYVKKIFKIYDYRDKWVGDWDFKIITGDWTMDDYYDSILGEYVEYPTRYDTSYYLGNISFGNTDTSLLIHFKEDVNKSVFVTRLGEIYVSSTLKFNYSVDEGNFYGTDSVYYKTGWHANPASHYEYVYGKKR